MKKIIFILLILVGGAVTGYYYYNLNFDEEKDLWSLVPDNILFVYESNNFNEDYTHLLESKMGDSFLLLDNLKEFNKLLSKIDTIIGEKPNNSLLNSKILISGHPTSSNTLGLTYYTSLKDINQKEAFGKIIDYYKNTEKYTLASRKYRGELIYELIPKEKGTTISYYINRSLVALSTTPFLIEDVIRVQTEDLMPFSSNNPQVFQFPKLSKDQGNIYFNTKKLSSLINLFVKDKTSDGDLNLANSTFYDLKVSDKSIILNGFTHYNPEDFINIFKGQQPSQSNLKNYIPNNSAYALQLSFSNSIEYYSRLKKYYFRSDSFKKEWFNFNNTYSLDTIFGASWVEKTNAIVSLSDNQGELYYVETNDTNEALNDLNTLGESIEEARGDSIYVENYGEYEIRELNVPNFIKYSYMPMVLDMEKVYYMAVDNYIIFSNSLINLKGLADNIEQENTWGRSVIYNKFLEKTLQEHNLSLVVNTQSVLENMEDKFNDKWSEIVKRDIEVLNDFRFQSYQLSRLDDSFYSSMVFEYSKKQVTAVTNFEVVQKSSINSRIISKPFVVKNHISNLREIVVFDSSRHINLISNNGEVLWSKNLDDELVGDLEQIDFYKNGKLQYFFTTKNGLEIKDRNGNDIEGFPVKTNFDVAHSKVIDYDNSKNYRFLVADARGNIYLYNKEGQILDGWGPKSLAAPFSSTPKHLRVRRKDAFVVVMNNGSVTLLNRRGEDYDGFPLDIQGKINTGVDINIGSDFESTIFTTISTSGKLIKFNMLGDIIASNQLYKPTKESNFKIISDALGKSYIIIRKDLNRVVILDQNGQELFAKDYLSAEEMSVQYYDFNSSNKLYVITDKIQGFTYIYKNDGKLINSRPIDSEYEVGVIYSQSKDELRVYCTSEKSFKILKFN